MEFIYACMVLICLAASANGQNIALRADVAQTSLWQNGPYGPERAVDGDAGKRFFQDTCMHTDCDDKNPSWTVCLGQMHVISTVTIHNPIEAHGRLKNIRIEVFQTNPNDVGAVGQVCATIDNTPIPDGISRTFTCPLNMRGRYIRISKRIPVAGRWGPGGEVKCDTLLLCEVEVTGTPFIDCPLGFTENAGSCYYISRIGARNWFEARDHCQTLGGDLAVVDSQAENDFLTGFIAVNDPFGNMGYFLGLHRLFDGETWRWIDPNAAQGIPNTQPNTVNPFSDWAFLQGNEPFEFCLRYGYDDFEARYRWYDGNCNNPNMYVCEISPTFPDPVGAPCDI